MVAAISLAWGADTSVVEAVLWEHSTVLARYPTRKFFQLGENLVEQVPSVSVYKRKHLTPLPWESERTRCHRGRSRPVVA